MSDSPTAPKKERPLAIVIAGVVQNNQILLLQRAKEPYLGLWSLPGGKIEKGEQIAEAAKREVMEETGIDCAFEKHLGIVSEFLEENGNMSEHFLIHVCRLAPKTNAVTSSNEGKAQLHSLYSLAQLKNSIIPSDYLMIEKLLLQNNPKNYYECIIEKQGNEHVLKKFELV